MSDYIKNTNNQVLDQVLKYIIANGHGKYTIRFRIGKGKDTTHMTIAFCGEIDPNNPSDITRISNLIKQLIQVVSTHTRSPIFTVINPRKAGFGPTYADNPDKGYAIVGYFSCHPDDENQNNDWEEILQGLHPLAVREFPEQEKREFHISRVSGDLARNTNVAGTVLKCGHIEFKKLGPVDPIIIHKLRPVDPIIIHF